MPISDVVNLSITVSGAGPTRQGFGEPLILAYHTHYTDRVREYSDLNSLVSDGFAVTDPAYLAAAEICAQNPRPPLFKVARRALPPTQTLNLTCLSTSATDTYVFQLRNSGGAWHIVTVASTGVPNTDVATINTAVTALGLTGVVATHSGAVLTLTQTAGVLVDVIFDNAHMSFADVTTDPGVATDLGNILAADPNWYGLLLDSQSAAEITAAAAWAESNGKLFGWNNSDTADANPSSTTDIFYTEKQLAHARSFGLFAYTQLLCYSAAAWMGRMFPTNAGSENWAFKTLAGIFADALTTNQIHAIENKNGSVYTVLAGLNLTQFGKQPSGQFIDITRGTDAFSSDLQVGIIALEANNLKVPFTDAGVDMFRSVIAATIKSYQDIGFLATSPPAVISLPLVANVGSIDKAKRNLPVVSFSATLAGAIDSIQIQGTLTV